MDKNGKKNRAKQEIEKDKKRCEEMRHAKQ
jgi:hypothetical protein